MLDLKDKNGILIQEGDEVEVADPEAGDMHCLAFTGRVDSFRDGMVVVVDQEDNAYQIEPERIETLG